MRYIATLFIIVFLVGVMHGQPLLEEKKVGEMYGKPIPTLAVEGKLIHPSPPPLQINGSALVNVGYGGLTEKFLTASVSSFSKGDFAHSGYRNIQEFLQGRVPGLRIIRTGLNSYSMRIRGVSSIMMSNEPLVVIDGIPMRSSDILSTMSPNDIKNVTVLKGPEAAIYGSRGANGVILVSTY